MNLYYIYSSRMCRHIQDWLPNATSIASFDCARRNMGVARAVLDCSAAVGLPGVQLTGDTGEKLATLEAHCRLLGEAVDRVLRVVALDVWDLGKDAKQPWQAAAPLKKLLTASDREHGVPDAVVYEFQMDLNDKSRMISTMIAYHYSDVPTTRVQPAVKNKVCVARGVARDAFVAKCPVTAGRRLRTSAGMRKLSDVLFERTSSVDLTVQEFLKLFNKTYDANKSHTSAMLEWWASIFHVDMSRVPRDCIDDAADAFIQIFSAFCVARAVRRDPARRDQNYSASAEN